MNRIRLTLGRMEIAAELDDSPTSQALLQALPLESTAHRWGDEIYFDVPVQTAEAPDARQDMEVGEIAYWPAGPALCLFFGPTPVSRGTRPRAYSNVNPCGRILGDAIALSSVGEGAPVAVELGGSTD
jgi:hypothetical protein